MHAAGTVWLAADGHVAALREHERLAAPREGAAADGAVTAPMPGTVTVVQVSLGDQVEAGTPLLVVEAMKMEHVLTAPLAGTVTELSRDGRPAGPAGRAGGRGDPAGARPKEE